MTDAELAVLERSCREQGVPLHVTDPGVLAAVARLITRASADHIQHTMRSDQDAYQSS